MAEGQPKAEFEKLPPDRRGPGIGLRGLDEAGRGLLAYGRACGVDEAGRGSLAYGRACGVDEAGRGPLAYGRVCGVDEAGRGPLAGPVYAAAVVLGDGFPVRILDDSKRLSPARRLEAEAVIKQKALAWAVAFATHKEIDALNILNAAMLAMRRAVAKLDPSLFDLVLVDGNRTPDPAALGKPAEAVVKGDALVPQIMAASILAKTQRDRIMELCDAKWPAYGFARHKGYPTPEHKARLREHGLTPIHRKTFRF